MRPAEEKYISLLTAFGFQRIFGKKPNKMQLIDFPNALFDGEQVFKVAEIAHFTPAELRHYEDSLKAFRDVKNCIDSAEEKGRAEGREEGRAEGRAEGERAKAIEIAQQLLAMHLPIDSITKATGLSEQDLATI